jgi:hypothetical protein
MSSSDPSMKAEERRALVLLGLLAVLVGLYDKLPSDAFYNFPANSPFPHLTIFVIPTLINMIYLWVGYGVCMFFYFSDDWFPAKRWWTDLRTFCHGLGLSLIGLLLVVGYFVVLAEVSFFLPDNVLGVYWIIATFGEALLIALVVESAFRARGLLRKAILAWGHSIVELAREVTSGILEALEAYNERRKRKKNGKRG